MRAQGIDERLQDFLARVLAWKEAERDAWVFGIPYFPDPAVAVKLDYTVLNNQSDVVQAPNSLNIGLGWWF